MHFYTCVGRFSGPLVRRFRRGDRGEEEQPRASPLHFHPVHCAHVVHPSEYEGLHTNDIRRETASFGERPDGEQVVARDSAEDAEADLFASVPAAGV